MPENEKYRLEPELWLDRHGDLLFSYARVRVNDVEKSADLVQETFLAGLKAKDSYRGQATEATWLISILKRKIIDFYRSRSIRQEEITDRDLFRQEEPFKGHWLEGEGPHSRSLLPEGKMEEEELMEIIRLCMEYLPPSMASVFIMKLIDEEETVAICKELDISPSNLWVLLHRARLKMRNCVEKRWES